MSRPKGRLSKRRNHHLKLVNGEWQVRIIRGGLGDVRLRTGTADVEKAREIRDRALAETDEKGKDMARRVALGVPEAGDVGSVIAMYLAAESREYDRDKGGRQPGCKRDSESDRVIERRIFRHLDGKQAIEAVDGETLLDLATALEGDGLAALTRRNTF